MVTSDIPFVAVLFTILIFDISGLIKREVARVWLIFTPFLIVSMADFSARLVRKSRKVFPFIAVLLFIQILFFEVFLDTIW